MLRRFWKKVALVPSGRVPAGAGVDGGSAERGQGAALYSYGPIQLWPNTDMANIVMARMAMALYSYGLTWLWPT